MVIPTDASKSRAIVLSARGLNVLVNGLPVLTDIDLDIRSRSITAIMGPPASGKTLLLQTINRTLELTVDCKVKGQLTFLNQDVYAPDQDPNVIRRKIVLVPREAVLLPKSIYENIAWSIRARKLTSHPSQVVEESLRLVDLWEEVKNRLHQSPGFLSRGQQLRLCIARAIATEPEILLLDEPTLELDPFSTSRVEDVLEELKNRFAIVYTTRSSAQAGRISDEVALLVSGRIEEFGPTDQIFYAPKRQITEAFLAGKVL